jgi:ribokinase
MRRARVVVVGSSNTDMTVTVDRLPSPGETVLGGTFSQAGGGKGANQAVAAARAGAEVVFVGRTGQDAFGAAARRALEAEGVRTDHLHVDEQSPSGLALIIVDSHGENLIAVAPGANARVSVDDVVAAQDAIRSADIVLLQLEVPMDAVATAARAASQAGVAVLLNPAPAAPVSAEALASVDYLVPNAVEAAMLLGVPPETAPAVLAERLVGLGVGSALVTLGADGVCMCEHGCTRHVRAPQVAATDTVGAGDCFCGVLATAIGEGLSLGEAVVLANCAAALSVQRAGAQPSLPRRNEIEQLVRDSTGASNG